MIDRIETQQSEESQEVKYYKTTSFIHAYPQTNFGYIDWANKTTHKASVPVSPGAGKHGFHLIHNKDTAFERHEWVAFADFQNTYHEHNAKSECDDNKKPNTVITEEDFAELKQAPYSRMTVLSILSPGHGDEPFTPVLISALNDYITALNNNDMGNDSLECVQFGNGYAIKAVHRTSPIQPEDQQDHQQSKPTDDELLNAYNRYMKKHVALSAGINRPLTYDEFVISGAAEYWIQDHKDGDPYNRKELDEKMTQEMFNAGNEITDNLVGSFAKGLNAGAGAGAAIDAASIKSALKTQFDKLKNDDLTDKHKLKLELDRTKAMVELAEAINIMDV